MISEQTKEAHDAAVVRLPLDKDGISPRLDEVTSAAAKAAKDYCSSMLEHMKGNINATLRYASELSSTSLPPYFAVAVVDQRKKSTPRPERQLSASAKAAVEYRAKTFELMTANVNATLEYAQQLANVRTPAEFIEASTKHARKQLELITTHTAALGMLSQALTTSNVERMTASITRVFSRQKA